MSRKKRNSSAIKRSNKLLKQGRYDKFIQDNIYLLTNNQIKNIIKVDYEPLIERIYELMDMGIIDKDNKIEKIDRDLNKKAQKLNIGSKCKIFKPKKKNKISESFAFEGVCVAEYKNFYLFETRNGYKESFLKVDLYTGEKLCVKVDWKCHLKEMYLN